MNREIKFRTWDKQNKEFAEWTNRDPFFDTSHGKIFFWERIRKEDGSYDGDIILQDYGDRFVLQQYTGLKDSKGVEIYEGDLVCCSTDQYSITAPVVFSPFGYGFVLDSSGRHGIGDSKHGGYISLISPIVSDEKITYEVVGNIFENKTNE